MKYLALIFTLVITVSTAYPQSENTVGLISYKSYLSNEGYNLIYPHNQPNVYLLNNCGEIVHTWENDIDMRPGNTAYITPEGNLVRTSRPSNTSDDVIFAGGGGATIDVLDWDGNIVYSYTENNENARLHHDIEVLPNGNFLAVSWEYKTNEEAINAGRDSLNLSQEVLWPDYIFEMNPDTGEKVWEWHVWDHLIQDFDETKENFGVVGDHPELVDINYDTNDGKSDWMHTNAIDYHPLYNQIMISVPTFHEVWIIDHSTTTEQAAGSTGGSYGRGGDIIYRWGNPETYRAGDSTDQKLFYQHDTHWNLDYLSPGHKDFGKVAVFNNRVGTDFSTANIFDPMFDDYEENYMIMDGQYIPSDFDVTITHPTPQNMYSTGLSSFQQLPNDNYLITVGRFGYSFEITPNNEIVWEYVTPIRGGVSIAQGDSLTINNNLTFRCHRYPLDYDAFSGKDLTSKGWIELEPNEDYCAQLTDTDDLIGLQRIKLYPVPANRMLNIDLKSINNTVEIFNLNGQKVYSEMHLVSETQIDVASWKSGIYMIVVDGSETGRVIISH